MKIIHNDKESQIIYVFPHKFIMHTPLQMTDYSFLDAPQTH